MAHYPETRSFTGVLRPVRLECDIHDLKEDSPPLIMDPLTLETVGYTDFGGKMKGQTFGAHHKIDPRTGNLCNIGYASSGLLTNDATYMEVDPAGELLFETWFKVPHYCMMHDFGLTEDYLVVHIVPIVSNWERLEARMPHFGFDTTLPVWLGVLPRRGEGKDMRWFKAPKTIFASHVMNAFNDGTKIYFDTPQAADTGRRRLYRRCRRRPRDQLQRAGHPRGIAPRGWPHRPTQDPVSTPLGPARELV